MAAVETLVTCPLCAQSDFVGGWPWLCDGGFCGADVSSQVSY